MADGGHLNFRESIQLADLLIRQTTQSFAFTFAAANDDPLRLDLPPIVGSGSSGMTPDSATLKIMATLYLQAEMEQAGIIAVAEVLTAARYELTVYDKKSASLLEEFDRRRRNWLDRTARERVFARVFGIGPLAKNEEGVLINRDFQSKFANFCLEIRRNAEDLRWRKTPGPMLDSALRQAATDLLVNLGSRRYGDIHESSRRIQEQLGRSITLLSDEGIGNAMQTRGMWNVLRAVLNPNVPDFARLTTRGQSGMNLLNWITAALPAISDGNYRQPIIEPNSPAVGWSEMWLQATGFDISGANNALRRAA
ncbi:MAG: hypothetical protein H7070_01680 [Saprospiraceae bacterium]|nr:hypothetical protein [Pyrinomonadaceae bacterium]